MVFITMDQVVSNLVDKTVFRVPGLSNGSNTKSSGDDDDVGDWFMAER